MPRKVPPPSKGSRTLTKVLERAVKVASLEGLAGLTVGRLAEDLKMSKSGLFAHFRSKQALELATIDSAWEIFADEVLVPAQTSREGIERLWMLCDLWLKHVEHKVFRGSYFFRGAFFEYAAQSGPVAERITRLAREWNGALKASLRAAQEQEEIDSEVDSGRVTFELAGLLLGAHWIHLMGEGGDLDKARIAIVRLLGKVATERIPASAFASLNAWRKFLEKRDR